MSGKNYFPHDFHSFTLVQVFIDECLLLCRGESKRKTLGTSAETELAYQCKVDF